MNLTVAMLWPQYPSNVGVLARTCEAIGATFVTSAETGVSCNTPQVPPLRVPIREADQWVRHRSLRARVVAVETGGLPLAEARPAGPDEDVVLLVGNERIGLDAGTLSRADEVVTLPQRGLCPSLNVAVAGSLAAYWFAGLLEVPS